MLNRYVAFYLRISDEDQKKGSNIGESNSISAQRFLLTDFVQKHKDLLEDKVVEFIDDGYSGINFERPAFQALLNAIKNGKIKCIVVKDFSRLGRNYLEVGNYLEQVFPIFGIRFISVNDNFDSFYNSAAGSIDIGFKNIVSEAYSKDLSIKIKSARKTRAEQGKFLTAFAPYGYCKDKKNKQKLVLDPECAPIVQWIFQLYLEGKTCADIARILNQKHVLCPLEIRRKRKEKLWQCSCYENAIWLPPTIHKILSDQRYTGDAVYGKLRPEAIGSHRSVKVPKEEWVIVPNVYDAIVTHEVFDEVARRKTRKKSNIKKEVKDHPLAKKIICRSCQHFFTRTIKGGKAMYHCFRRSFMEETTCYAGNILEEELEILILYSLQRYMELLEEQEVRKNIKYETKECELELIEIEKSIKQLKNNKFELYEDYKRDKFAESDFVDKIKKQEKNIRRLQQKYNRLKEQYIGIQKINFTEKKIKQWYRDSPFQGLTKEIINEFIESIYVEGDGLVSIKWNFQNPFVTMGKIE